MNAIPSQFLKWSAVPGADSYDVERLNGTTVEDSFTTEFPEIQVGTIFSGLALGDFRTFRVRATDEFGAGPFSTNIGLTLVSGLVAPSNVHVE